MGNLKNYRADIDGLRAVAVLAVVAFHAAPGRLPGGFIGVDIFFVISGYLISSILLNSLEKGKFSILEFYERRIRRIFPALSIVLLACAIAGWLFLLPGEYQQLGKHTLAGAAFVSNFALWSESGYFDNAADFKILLHLWSLGIEEQFYIFWPILLWFAFRKKWPLPLAIGLVAMCSFVLNIHLSNTNPISAFYLPLPRFWELAAGAMLASTAPLPPRFSSPWHSKILANTLSVFGALLLLAGFIFIDEESVFPGWWALLPVLGAVSLIAAGPQSLFNRLILSNRVMVWFGLISYPLYLWHWPILSFLRTMEGHEISQTYRAIGVVAAIVLAWLTYRLIEMPIRYSAKKNSTILALMGLLTALGLFGAGAYLSNGFKNRASSLPKVINAGDVGHTEFFQYITKKYYPCMPKRFRDTIPQQLGIVHCFQSKSQVPISVALIGDSHAEHLFIGLAEALPNENVVFYGTDQLPFITNNDLALAFNYVLSEKSIDVIVLSAMWGPKLQASVNADWQAELAATVKQLSDSGKHVYITDDIPEFEFLPNRCKYTGRFGIENRCSQTMLPANLTYLPAFESLQSKNEGLTLIKTYNSFCENGDCSMATQGELYYRDENHLNINGSKQLGHVIVNQMKNP